MAKKIIKLPKHETGSVITTESWFGSRSSQVVDTPEGLVLESNQVVCQDDKGLYITEVKNLDNGLADPNRYGSSETRL